MEILQELPVEKWPQLQEKLKQLWPMNVPGYYTLHVNLKNPAIREAFKFKVYCPYGNMDNGFVAINKKVHQDVIFFSINEDTSYLEEALLKTKLINWGQEVYFDLVTSLTVPLVERVHAVMKFEMYKAGLAKTFHLEGTTNIFDLRKPDNTYFSALKPIDIQRVDDTWPYKNSDSHRYFNILAANGLSYSLYSSETDELLAWIFINEYNFLCHFYCEEKHRKRGYGEYVLAQAVNELLKDGHDIYAYVVEGNKKPLPLFAKFGFKPIDDGAFIFVEKPTNIFS